MSAEVRAAHVLRRLREVVEPEISGWERHGLPMEAAVAISAELGLSTMRVPQSRGGNPRPWTEIVEICRSVGRVYVSLGLPLQNNLIAGLLGEHANDLQWARWGAPIANGTALAGLAINEPGAGNDLGALACSLKSDGELLRLNGEKAFIPAAGSLPWLLVVTGHGGGTSMVVVPTDTPGVTIGSMGSVLAPRGLDLCAVRFDDCVLPPDHVIGRPGAGFGHLRPHLLAGRLLSAGLFLGTAEEALDLAVASTASTVRFGQPLIGLGAVQQRLGDMAARTIAAADCLQAAAAALDAGDNADARVSAAKVFATDVAVEVATQAMHLLGGWGVLEERTVERLLREAAVGPIVDGANDLHRTIIALGLAERR